MGFSVRFFVALGVACVIRMTWAAECSVALQNCGSGQYNARNCQTGGLHSVLGYSCVACPDGYPESDVGTPQTINDCYKLDNCKYYHGGQVADGEGYHVENNTCYPNTRACSDFVVDHFAVGWNCDQWAQVGNAEWRPSENAWDTKNCTCSVVDRDIVHDVGGVAADGHCIAANSDFYVTDADRYRTTSVNDHVRYSFRHQFCRQCEPGYLPKIENAQVNGVYLRPGNDGNWGVVTCDEQVQTPYYSDRCVIDFNLSTGNAAQDGCRKPCPDGFATESDGATSVTYCQYDGHTTYTDDTGSFYIGSLEDCP